MLNLFANGVASPDPEWRARRLLRPDDNSSAGAGARRQGPAIHIRMDVLVSVFAKPLAQVAVDRPIPHVARSGLAQGR